MITSLVSGKLISDPRSGQSANGNAWTRITLSSSIAAPKEGEAESIVIAVIAFGDQAKKLENLRKGDSVSAVGSTKISTWQKGEETRTGLDLVATEVLTPYQVKQKRNAPKDDGGGRERFDNYTRGLASSVKNHGNDRADFDDQISF